MCLMCVLSVEATKPASAIAFRYFNEKRDKHQGYPALKKDKIRKYVGAPAAVTRSEDMWESVGNGLQ